MPFRRWLWHTRRRPFVFTGERGLTLRLFPGEYLDGEIFVHGVYEYRLLHLLAAKSDGGIFVDVGANIGNHSLYLADSFDEVLSFEPNPTVAARLRENIRLSGKPNVHVHEVGLGEADGALPFHEAADGNAAIGSFARDDMPISGFLPVRVGDEVLADMGAVRLLKIDVEGFELQVFRGLRGVIERDRPIVVFEHDARRDAAVWDQIREYLPDYRFAWVSGIPGTGLAKVVAALRDGVATRLTRLERPEPRYYEAVLAFPSDQDASRFGLKDE